MNAEQFVSVFISLLESTTQASSKTAAFTDSCGKKNAAQAPGSRKHSAWASDKKRIGHSSDF